VKVLVTGGAGFIGSHIVEHFQGKADIRVIDDLRTGKKSNLDGFEAEFIEGSILDKELLKQSMQGVDLVFHLAAMVSIPECIEKPGECFEINAEGTKYVLQEAADAGVKKLVLSTTCAVYGNDPELPKREEMNPDPLGPYAESKLKAEGYCREFTENGKLQTACLRYFNVFGPRQDPKSPYAAAVPIFVSLAVQDRPITIYGDGEQTRDFVYVKDVVGANVFMSGNESTGTYNVAYGNQTSVKDLAEMIVEITSSESEIIHVEPREGEVKYSMASIEKLRDQGFSPSSEFKEGLKETIRFFSNSKK